MSWRKRLLAAAAVLCTCALYLGQLRGYPLQDPDEGRYAEIPREMVETGDWVTPRLNYVDYFEKPPLLYWAVAGSYRLLGTNEGAARLVSAVSGLLTLALTFALGARWFGWRAAAVGTALLATTPFFFVFSQFLIIDMLLTACLTACLYALVLARQSAHKRAPAILAAVAAALGVLAKGPVALALPGGIAVGYLLWQRDWPTFRAFLRPTPIAAFLAIAAPWFVLVSWRNPDFAYFFFVHENFLRFTSAQPGHHPASAFYYVPVVLAGFLPWSALAALLAARVESRSVWREISAEARGFLALWAFVVIGFFSLASSKLAPYALPAFPPLALLLGAWIDRVLGRTQLLAWATGSIALLLVALGAILFGAGASGLVVSGWISDLLDRGPQQVWAVSLAGVLTGAVLLIGGSLTRRALRHGGAAEVGFGMLVATVAVGLFAALPARDAVKSSRHLARAIVAERSSGDLVVNYQRFFQGLGFYTSQRVILVDPRDRFNEIHAGARTAKDREEFLWADPERLSKAWSSGRRVFIVTNQDREGELRSLLRPEPRRLVKDDRRVVLVNFPDAARPGPEPTGSTAGRDALAAPPGAGRTVDQGWNESNGES